MSGRIDGKSVVITGGSSGMGAACARRFAAEGADSVVIGDVNPAGAAIADELRGSGTRALFVPTDVSRKEACTALVAAAVEFAGHIDIALAAAGVSHGSYLTPGGELNPRTPLVELAAADWQRVMEINVDGVFYFDQAVAAHLLARGARGAIVNIASMNAQRTAPGVGAYSVSKAAVWMLTKSFAVELASSGIRVNAVGPGYITTSMTERMIEADPGVRDQMVALTPLGRMGTTDDIADAVLYLASDESSFVTGTILYPDGGYLAGVR
jgi:NAD(P)-dependent dehydrogenase (short-subunit alcohol dehydrogenase family)